MQLHGLDMRITKGKSLDGTKSIILDMYGNSESLIEDTQRNRDRIIADLERAILFLKSEYRP